MVKICFFVPPSHIEDVKLAMFDAGAGRIGNYDQCSWQTLGQGQFRPLDGSQPFIGEKGQCENVEEYRVEMVCDAALAANAVSALKQAHPYEEPAYDVIQVLAM
ncbi:MAG: YqfO family protein [Agarilytica sp.]